ncbi:phage baseplate assembly protein [Sulfitobacter sp. 1A15106]|uniref:phage baseplate assembly protein n=1 Tax=Sulfitobacter sp. 1A15106 TaxID=3368590 RepID=UPI003747648B
MGLTMLHDGKEYANWTSISVEASSTKATRGFTATVIEVSPDGLDAPFWMSPGDEVAIYADGHLLVRGYINEYRPTFDANSHSVTISGRGKSQDAVDCSARHATGRFENMTVGQIANELAGIVGITVEVPEDTQRITKFQVNQGETICGAINRLSKSYGLNLQGLPDGNMKLSKGTDGDRLSGALVQGQWPFLAGSATISDAQKFSDYEVKSQLAGAEGRYGTQAAQEVGRAVDRTVKRYRPHVAVSEIASPTQTAAERASWQARRIAGKSVKADVTVQGFHLDGQLWAPDRLVYVQSAMLKMDHEMLIESVKYTQDDNGSRCDLKLVPPKASKSTGGKKRRGGAGSSSGSGSEAYDGVEPENGVNPPSQLGEWGAWKWPVGPQ